MFGGRPTPSCGFALGVERLIDLMKMQECVSAADQVDVYIVHQGEEAMLEAFVLAETLRGTGLDVILHCSPAASGSSFKAQMKRADGSGAMFAILLGDDELKERSASVKALRSPDEEGNQNLIPLSQVADYLIDQIIGAADDEMCGCGCGDLCATPAQGIH
jgi:histidyl-tRNA synthetase